MLLYIHIPFCKRICSYCDFYHTTCLDLYPKFIEKIKNDITQSEGGSLKTLYFGGGTPSTLSIDDLSEIILSINRRFDTVNLKEITIECNPDDLTLQYCKSLYNIGINRLSIGIQSFCDDHLKTMNRRHNADQAISAVMNAKDAGFRNITIDLIYGLPFMTESQWQFNLDTAIKLDIQHISAYHLTIEKGTLFDRMNIKPVSEDVSVRHYKMLRESLLSNGFSQYEISNFCKAGYSAIHNSGYWDGVPYLGLGPSAHSFDGKNKRWWEPSSLTKWLNGERCEIEILSSEQRAEEIIMTSLRTTKGLKTSDEKILNSARNLLSQGLMEYTNGYLKIRPEHFLISDYIICELF